MGATVHETGGTQSSAPAAGGGELPPEDRGGGVLIDTARGLAAGVGGYLAK